MCISELSSIADPAEPNGQCVKTARRTSANMCCLRYGFVALASRSTPRSRSPAPGAAHSQTCVFSSPLSCTVCVMVAMPSIKRCSAVPRRGACACARAYACACACRRLCVPSGCGTARVRLSSALNKLFSRDDKHWRDCGLPAAGIAPVGRPLFF